MDSLDSEIEVSINKLIRLDEITVKEKKEIILEIGDKLEKAIKNRSPRTLNRLKLLGLKEETQSIAQLISWIIEKNNLSIGKTWLYHEVPKKWKHEKTSSGESDIVRLSDKYLEEHAEELMEKLRRITQGPAKDIKLKTKKTDDIDKQGWNTKTALALVLLAKKIDEEGVEKELDDEISDKINMVKDGRFATTWGRYEAIVVAVQTTKSLTHAIEEEQRPLTREEITKNENNCKECYCEGSPKSKCDCHCHRTTQAMTTNGLKWAIKHNKRLGEFNESIKRISDMEREDICQSMKRLFTNPNMDKHLTHDDKMNLYTRHIEKEQCIRCEMFLEEHPEFFKSDK